MIMVVFLAIMFFGLYYMVAVIVAFITGVRQANRELKAEREAAERAATQTH